MTVIRPEKTLGSAAEKKTDAWRLVPRRGTTIEAEGTFAGRLPFFWPTRRGVLGGWAVRKWRYRRR